MLIKNTSKIIIEVQIELLFDDGSKKKDIIKVGDKVKLVYRKNFKKIENIGIIRAVTTRLDRYQDQKNGTACRQSFVCPYLEVDFSEDFESYKDRIPVDDILDFEIIERADPEGIDPTNFSIAGYGALGFAGVFDNDCENTDDYDYDDEDDYEEGGCPCA